MYAQTKAAENYAGSGLGSSIAQADVAQRQREVPALMDRLERRTEHLTEMFQLLNTRLTGYLARPEPPSPQSSNPQAIKAAVGTGLGVQLDGVSSAIEDLSMALQSLMERLEA